MQPLENFLAILGHELRNPLAVIVAALNVLRERDGGLQRETEIIERQTNQLVRLISDLVQVSRITSGEIPLQRRPADLEAAIAQAVESAGPHVTGRSHALAIDVAEELLLDADPERLAQVLASLLINAAIYTPRRGRIQLTARREGSDAQIKIRDNGNGITADLLPRIFEPFVQGRENRSHAEAGLGIGLTMARMLVEAHGGTIVARSNGAGTGAELEIRWPCASAHAVRASPTTS